MNTELQKELNDLKDKLSDIEKRINQPQFEVGKWYKSTVYKDTFLVYNDDKKTYGFWDGKWGGTLFFTKEGNIAPNTIPATESEIKEALIKEAERRGFKGGVKLKRLPFCSTEVDIATVNYWEYDINISQDIYERLSLNGTGVYQDGQWAEIITEPSIKIGEYEVKFNGKESITVGRQTISKETIQTILDKLK